MEQLVVIEEAGGRDEEQDRRSHVRVSSAAAGGVADFAAELALLLVVGLAGRHLAGKDARCNLDVKETLGFNMLRKRVF